MFRHFLSCVLAVSIVLAVAAAVSADTETVTVVRLTDQVDIAAPPAKVWATMTSGTDLSWCLYWQGDANKKVKLTKVGDVLEFQDDWGNKGHSIVTYLAPNKELRIANEPADGSYMCQSRLMLEESDGGTTVTYIEQYTDESSDEDMDATAASMEESIAATLQKLKKKAEKKGGK